MIKLDFTKETITIFIFNKSSIYDAVEYMFGAISFIWIIILDLFHQIAFLG